MAFLTIHRRPTDDWNNDARSMVPVDASAPEFECVATIVVLGREAEVMRQALQRAPLSIVRAGCVALTTLPPFA